MAVYHVGELIRTLRKQKGLSQEDLADSITDRANLSRIENGVITPSKKTIEALLERLGFGQQEYMNFYLGTEMTEIQRLLDELESHVKNQRTAEADELIAKLEAFKEFEDGLYRQHLLCDKAANEANKKGNIAEIRALVDEAIKITIPTFHEKYIVDYLLTKQEFRLINIMALTYEIEGNLDDAIKIMYDLKECFDKNCVDMTFKGRHYPLIIYNLTNYLTRAKKYKESVRLCDVGMQCCIDTESLRIMPSIIMNKIACLYRLGDVESCHRLIRQAYYSLDMYEMYEDRDWTKKYAKNKLGIDL